jgi:hypothetical protein
MDGDHTSDPRCFFFNFGFTKNILSINLDRLTHAFSDQSISFLLMERSPSLAPSLVFPLHASPLLRPLSVPQAEVFQMFMSPNKLIWVCGNFHNLLYFSVPPPRCFTIFACTTASAMDLEDDGDAWPGMFI